MLDENSVGIQWELKKEPILVVDNMLIVHRRCDKDQQKHRSGCMIWMHDQVACV
ncbi:hypothetical protein HanPI659440_Chr01g0016121 [Helianthus annuus]|nr:hypothetical protein HanPI659440_Chr01g0016121 [Helianthus annuus]